MTRKEKLKLLFCTTNKNKTSPSNGTSRSAPKAIKPQNEVQDPVKPFRTDDKLKTQAMDMFQRGMAYSRPGVDKYDKALVCFQKALNARKFKYGPGHVLVISVHIQMGDILLKLNRIEEANFHYEAAGLPKVSPTAPTDRSMLTKKSTNGKQTSDQSFATASTSCSIRSSGNLELGNGLTNSYLNIFSQKCEM